jgi:glutamine synthetase
VVERRLRVVLKLICYGAAEYEFYQFRAPQSHDGSEKNTSSTATFLRNNPVDSLPSLTEGMFGYSITRPVHNQEYYYGIFDTCAQFNCGIEGWHTESGPGVFEAVSLARWTTARRDGD